jgi:glyoxylase-like metal-dependent hydrolase (beta-lactamase superfamily II)
MAFSGAPICRTCGVQQDVEAEVCPICADDRQYVGWNGQLWTTVTSLAADGHRGVVREEVAGLYGVGAEPATAIGQRALLVPGEGGNVLWDCVSVIDDATVDAVRAQGGIAAIAISHPHFFGSMVEWSDAFGGVPIYVHEADREWVRRSGNVVFWSGDTREILPGRTLVNCGVHFPGGTVLHWAGGRALCTGDIVMVVMDRRWVSFMYSYPNLIPEHPETIARAVRLLEPFDFDSIYGGWWGRVLTGDAKSRLLASAARYNEHIGLDR